MTDYATLPTAQIDSDSALIEDTMLKLRDNPLAMFEGASGAPRLQSAAIDTGAALANIGAAGITQGYLNTSSGTVSLSATDAGDYDTAFLPGGQYGFWPQGDRTSSGTSLTFGTLGFSTAFSSRVGLYCYSDGTTSNVDFRQLYINSSPPYNLGDGPVPLFVFARINSAGQITGTYIADVPPWGYNGPTRVTADFVDSKTGKKYQNKKILNPETGDVMRATIEIDDAIKNADMGLIPHPFTLRPGETVILLDPPETEELLDLHETGESITELLKSSDLQIDNSPIQRAAPSGVMPVAVRWKNTKQKWRAAPAIAAKLQRR